MKIYLFVATKEMVPASAPYTDFKPEEYDAELAE